ncbi:MAG: hypothetical protein AAGF12_31820 [Myxococcota bacterium]
MTTTLSFGCGNDRRGGAASPDGSVSSADASDRDADGSADGMQPVFCGTGFEWSGFRGCRTTVESLDVKFFPLEAGRPVERLVLHFHGDGANTWDSNQAFDPEILQWAAERNYLVLGFLATSMREAGDGLRPAYGTAQPENAEEVVVGVETFLDRYAVVNRQSLYWGVSGGSWFFTSSYIPAVGHRVPGIFVANCGGSGTSFGWNWVPTGRPDVVEQIALYANYGDQDFLAERSRESIEEYDSMGFVTDELVHEGATHCAHPIAGPTLAFWERHL